MNEPWKNTTHDWGTTVDEAHLSLIASHPSTFAPSGVLHLLHEVLAYVADEAEAVQASSRRCEVTLHEDGSISVCDYGRGTNTRRDEGGRVVRKPVMATKDLRFFDDPDAPALPDGHPRKGISVVAALSELLMHENRRHDGGWRQRYTHGIPIDGLDVLNTDGSTGTLVHYRPVTSLEALRPGDLTSLPSDWPMLDFTSRDDR